jgi:hypothetical protein
MVILKASNGKGFKSWHSVCIYYGNKHRKEHMKTYKLTYYCRRSTKDFSSDPEIAAMQADTWLRSLGLDLYKIEELKPTDEP